MREIVTLLPLAFMVLWVGTYPSPLMELMDTSVDNLVDVTSRVIPLE